MQAMIQMADAVTTPSETLAALFRQTGQEHVQRDRELRDRPPTAEWSAPERTW